MVFPAHAFRSGRVAHQAPHGRARADVQIQRMLTSHKKRQSLPACSEPPLIPTLLFHRPPSVQLSLLSQHFKPPSYRNGDKGPAQFHPDLKYEILQQLFGFPEGTEGLAKAKTLYIEPPIYVDYGTNVKFKGWGALRLGGPSCEVAGWVIGLTHCAFSLLLGLS